MHKGLNKNVLEISEIWPQMTQDDPFSAKTIFMCLDDI